ncbi:hypothetical protein KY347_05460 [Candidatus Woesearchaeota archaeon]|nr:hypothetical protein [Candidatus Woesearchaeota archaeon]
MEILLPFLLIFTILFAVLEKTRILGEAKRNMNIGLAIVFSLVTVIPHITGDYPAGYDPIEVINSALPSVSLLVVAIIALMILIGVFAHDRLFLGATMPGWIAFFSIVAIVWIFGSAAGWWEPGFMGWLDGTFGSNAVAVVIMLLVFGIIIAFVTGGGERDQVGALNRLGVNLGELFGGKK